MRAVMISYYEFSSQNSSSTSSEWSYEPVLSGGLMDRSLVIASGSKGSGGGCKVYYQNDPHLFCPYSRVNFLT